MTEELPAATAVPARRQPWWLLAVLLVLAAGAGLGVGALIWAGDPKPQASPAPAPYPSGFIRLTPEEYDKCVREVFIHFPSDNTNQAMQDAAAQLRNDPRFERVRPRTRQESFDEFMKVFADQPDLIAQARPESIPPAVILTVRAGLTGKQQEKSLREQFPDTTVNAQDFCPR